MYMKTDQLRAVSSAAAPLQKIAGRLDSIDVWRGLVIILMVLDHVRDFFHYGAASYAATDPATTTLPLFATRWITHLCAPTFIFLAGVSIRLQREKLDPGAGLSAFLLSRGLWLLLLEMTVLSFGFNAGWPFFFGQVIYAIGASMALMAAIVLLPSRAVLALGVAAVAGAPLLIAPLADAGGWLGVLRTLAILPGTLPGVPGIIIYPFLPWLGVMCLGYGYGHVFRLPPATRNRVVAVTAVSMLLAFVVLRGLNGYGDLNPWKVWPSAVQTVESFLDVSKYPASPDYVLVTLGISMLLFLALERCNGRLIGMLRTFGRTPMFTYLLHLYLAHGVQILAGTLLGFPLATLTNFIAQALTRQPGEAIPLMTLNWGVSLWATYAIWLAVLAALYPLSRWFEGVKQRRSDWWLRYL